MYSIPPSPYASNPCSSFNSNRPLSTTNIVDASHPPIANKVRTGSFWDDVSNADGENHLGAILMDGLLGARMDLASNPKGELLVQALDVQGNYRLSIVDEKQAFNSHQSIIRKVYWLPWSSGQDTAVQYGHTPGCEFVSIADLNKLDCNFFMTSNLSGCRFVQTDQYLAHISQAQSVTLSQVTVTPSGRDAAEQRLIHDYRPTRRAALSQSKSSRPFIGKGLVEATGYSYQRNKEGTGSAFVIGIKQPDKSWNIKYLKHSIGEGYADGIWTTMNCGEDIEIEEKF